VYILNAPRSNDESSDKEEKMKGLCKEVENNGEVPHEDKEKMRKLCKESDNVKERALLDSLTRSNIWDCFVEIFHGGLHAY